eukprot:4317606-Alexandrium_andersonii.AAC.2
MRGDARLQVKANANVCKRVRGDAPQCLRTRAALRPEQALLTARLGNNIFESATMPIDARGAHARFQYPCPRILCAQV